MKAYNCICWMFLLAFFVFGRASTVKDFDFVLPYDIQLYCVGLRSFHHAQ